jgi:NitT/TauT family transport system substrate-binding protein
MNRFTGFALAAALAIAALPAHADDVVKLTIGQRGNWDTAIAHLGSKAGIFKKHNLELELLYTSGSGETLQPVIAGSADLGLAVGSQGAMSAFAKGAPVRIVGAQATGAADYWYAKASSTIKTLQDTNGRTIAFSTQGSSTQSIVRAFIDEFKLTAKPVATGNPSATLTQVMTDQVDVGWASPPFGLKEIDANQIRIVARGTDSASVRGQTVRVIVANTDGLAKRKDALVRFMDAYR